MNVKVCLLGLLCLGLAACKDPTGGHCTDPTGCNSDSSGKKFTVTASASQGGQISPSSVVVKNGKTAAFQVTADVGYAIDSVSGCGGALVGNSFTTGKIKAACTVTAVFKSTATDTAAPVANIVFPSVISRTDEKTITVRGVASDPSGVAEVLVNGVPATIVNSVLAKNKADATHVNWQVVLPLDYQPQVALTVETRDKLGNSNSNSATANVLPQTVPVQFAFNERNHFLYGLNRFNELSINELDTGFARTLPITGEYYGYNPVYVPSLSSIVASVVFDQDLTIYQLSTSTGVATTSLVQHLGYDTNEWSFANVTDASYSASDDSLYLLLTYFSALDYNLNKSVIFKYSFANQSLSLIADRQVANGTLIRSDAIKASPNGLYVFNDYFGFGNDGISLISSDGANLSPISESANITASKIALDLSENAVYLTGFNGIKKVSLSDGTQSLLSPETPNGDFSILQPLSTAVDKTHNRLLIGDSSLDIVMGVDLQTGERSTVLTNGVGSGSRIVAPREIALDEVNQLAYVLDDNLGQHKSLLRVDLTTGNRHQLGDMATLGWPRLNDIVFDPTKKQIYISTDNEIWRFDIASEQFSLVTGSAKGSGPELSYLSGMAIGILGEQLFVVSSVPGALYAVDVATGDRVLLSQDGARGNGTPLEMAVDVEIDQSVNTAYVLTQKTGEVVSVNLTNGDRVSLLSDCFNANGVDKLVANSGSIQNLFFERNRNALLITGHALLRYDLTTKACSTIESPSNIFNRTILDMAENSAGQLFVVSFNKLMQFDDVSRERVIISK